MPRWLFFLTGVGLGYTLGAVNFYEHPWVYAVAVVPALGTWGVTWFLKRRSA
jgi:hypothetical protein